MKTLDEVIKALTICKKPDTNRNCKDCPMPDTHECMGVLMTDALHYLKEYKIKRERIMAKAQDCEDTEKRLQDEIARYQEAVRNCELAENKYRKLSEETSQNSAGTSQNDPLTWDELKQMEGKSVWVETKTEGGRWGIVREFRLEDETRTTCIGFTPRIFYHVLFECQNGVIDCFEHNYGKTWQAYRKERATGGYLRPEPQSVKIGSDVEVKWHEADNREGLK